MRKILIEKIATVAVAIAFLTSVFGMDVARAAVGGCKHQNFRHLLSPDKSWDVVVYDDVCEFGYVFIDDDTTVVQIVSTSNTSNAEDVFSIDAAGNLRGEPIVSWINNNTLKVSTIHSPYIGVQKNSFSTIKIVYVYRHI